MTSLRFLLDTDTFIYLRQRRSPQVIARFDELKFGETAISVVTWGELVYGAEKSRHPAKSFAGLEDLATLVPILHLPEEAGRIYGIIRAGLEMRGIMIASNDAWIAAHARALGATLITNNEREFRRVDGLKVENWVRQPPNN
jgi:tRNA(fMet)-specific endonuclease VapC